MDKPTSDQDHLATLLQERAEVEKELSIIDRQIAQVKARIADAK
jgi:hypothetical protein